MNKVQLIWVGIAIFVAIVLGITITYILHRETGLVYHLDRPRGLECSEQSRLAREFKDKYDFEAKAAKTAYLGPSGHWDNNRYATELNAAMARFKASQETLKAQFGCDADISVLPGSDPTSFAQRNAVPLVAVGGMMLLIIIAAAKGKIPKSGGASRPH